MCFGGGGSKPQPAVINMPDTGAYDRQFDRQLQMMQMSQSAELTGLQSQLDSSVMKQQELLTELRDIELAKAESAASVEAEARRMSNIIGAPPPEQTAKAPVIAEARDLPKTQSAKGKRGLRIGRAVADSSGQSVGYNLNI